MVRGAAVGEGPCEEEVCELAARFWKLKFLCGEEQFAEATEIGFRLRAWRDEFWAESSWLCWLEEHLRIPAEPVTKPASALSPERRPFVPFVIVTDSGARYCVPTGDGPAPSAKTLGEALGVQGLNYFFASRDPKVTGIRSNILSFWPPSVGRAQRQLLTSSERYQPANSGDRPALSWQSLALAHLSFILKYGRLKDFHRSQEFRAAPLSQNQ